MADLNEWQLQYPGTAFTFGTYASTYPFSAQVDIGDTEFDTQDRRHPTSDGEIMGKDTLGGFDLTFALTTVPDYPPVAGPWRPALDLFSQFKGQWRADVIRRNPGAYATLMNMDRNRLVYGRPRKIGQDLKKARKGVIGYQAQFRTNDPNFYSGTEKMATITPGGSSSGGILAPVVSPVSTVGSVLDMDAAVNVGDLPTWPIIDFHGPFTSTSLDLLDGSTVIWNIAVPGGIKFDEILTVDTRPWSRSATINGRPANGRIRGTQLERCQLPVGIYQWRYNVSDRTGTAYAAMRWRDAYASL